MDASPRLLQVNMPRPSTVELPDRAELGRHLDSVESLRRHYDHLVRFLDGASDLARWPAFAGCCAPNSQCCSCRRLNILRLCRCWSSRIDRPSRRAPNRRRDRRGPFPSNGFRLIPGAHIGPIEKSSHALVRAKQFCTVTFCDSAARDFSAAVPSNAAPLHGRALSSGKGMVAGNAGASEGLHRSAANLASRLPLGVIRD